MNFEINFILRMMMMLIKLIKLILITMMLMMMMIVSMQIIFPMQLRKNIRIFMFINNFILRLLRTTKHNPLLSILIPLPSKSRLHALLLLVLITTMRMMMMHFQLMLGNSVNRMCRPYCVGSMGNVRIGRQRTPVCVFAAAVLGVWVYAVSLPLVAWCCEKWTQKVRDPGAACFCPSCLGAWFCACVERRV